MSNIFQKVSLRQPKKSSFDLSHEVKLTANMGDLIPIICEDIIPGDTWNMNTEIMMRMMPMVAPIMHRVNVYTHFFFVPYRIIHDNWQNFITGGPDGKNNTVLPYFRLQDTNPYLLPGKLPDYMGVQLFERSSGEYIQINSLPFRAYQMIWNEFYRDQNLQAPLEIPMTDGQEYINVNGLLSIRKRAWEKDYFTSALPWTQKGDPVVLPSGAKAPVVNTQEYLSGQGDPLFWRSVATGAVNTESTGKVVFNESNGEIMNQEGTDLFIDPKNSLEADLSQTNTTVNQLRLALRLQEWFERNARAGSRYVEQILSHFGVQVPDYRLQRPEFLGGGKSPVVISEVLQTSSTDSVSPQGTMAGHGLSVGNTHGFRKTFSEHGVMIGILSVLPKTGYMQGIRRNFLKTDKFEFAWPEFAQLGEQEVWQGELAADAATMKNTFGYQARYSEYKYIPSSAHGEMAGSLEFWNMVRKFENAPALNEEFVAANPTHRIFPVTDPDEHKLIIQLYHNIKAIRPLPYFSTPSII